MTPPIPTRGPARFAGLALLIAGALVAGSSPAPAQLNPARADDAGVMRLVAAFNGFGVPTRVEDVDDYQGRLLRQGKGASGDLTANGPAEFVEVDFSVAREPRGRALIKERADYVRKHWFNFKENVQITPTHKGFDQGDGAPFAGPLPLNRDDDIFGRDRRSNVRIFLLAEDRFASVTVSAFEPRDPAKDDQYGPLAAKARKKALDVLKVLATLDVTTGAGAAVRPGDGSKTSDPIDPVGPKKSSDPARPGGGTKGGGTLRGEARPSYGAALLALRVSVKLADHDPALDVDGDGKVDARDAAVIAQRAATALKEGRP